jgi:hypothetical protein
MNTFEKKSTNDTVLGGGLVTIAIAWVVFAAIQGPVSAELTRATSGYLATSMTAPQQADTSPRATALPANAKWTAGNKVS